MKHMMLDKLVCPNDQHFPLELQIESTVDVGGFGPVCEQHCAKEGRLFEAENDGPNAERCRECHEIEIEKARLHCPACGDVFEVEQGIPRLLHHLEGTMGDEDKQKEMRARDTQAVKYDSLAFLKLLSAVEIPITMQLLKPDPSDLVVELGAGTGRLTARVAQAAMFTIAVDFSVESLALSRQKCRAGNVGWLQADINRLPLRDGVADRLLSCQVFEHLPGVSMRNMAIDEAARVLKSRGVFTISVYRDSWFWRLWGPKEGYHAGGIYYCRLSGREFEDMLGRQFTIRQHVPNVGMYLQMARCVKKPV